MPISTDFELARYADGTLVMPLTPPTAIGGWTVRFQIYKRMGGSTPLVTKWAASGFGNGVSGITITNSGQGVLSVPINSSGDMSGQDPGNYFYQFDRLDSGASTPRMADGYIIFN